VDFIANQKPQIDQMVQDIEIENIEALFKAIPDNLRTQKPLKDDGLSECEGLNALRLLSNKNTFSKMDNYLGAGAYEHYTPAVVDAIIAKSEFLTAYTPYQAEASQGYLQAIYEFQTALCALTGLDVSNASVYDGASAVAEALLMALRLSKKNTLLIPANMHPHYKEVVMHYLGEKKSLEIPQNEDGTLDKKRYINLLHDDIAAVLFQVPNFYGQMEDLTFFIDKAKEHKALVIISANPLSYALYKSAAEWGADIAVGDLQPLGIPLQFGGPYAGYISCRDEFVRQMPGRIVGKTEDLEGKEGYVLALRAREQDIRREKATSNICTNQALAALTALVTLCWYGKKGLYELALTNFQRASYLKESLCKIKGIKALSSTAIFNEFTLVLEKPVREVMAKMQEKNIAAGLALENNCLLVAVTEMKTQEQLDRYVQEMERCLI
jgi:glycine dehydrogenase subunit 1